MDKIGNHRVKGKNSNSEKSNTTCLLADGESIFKCDGGGESRKEIRRKEKELLKWKRKKRE